jgi:RNA polymerase sigma factor (TIGR02999 family)
LEKFFIPLEREKVLNGEDITQLLLDWNNGDEEARNELMPRVEKELRLIANRYLRKERKDHTLQATALINEAYIRLVDQKNVQWQNRAHFFGIAAQMMRRILVDHARSRVVARRGGGEWHKISLDKALNLPEDKDQDLVALDDALNSLAEIDPQKSKVVELRFFGGLTIEETAEFLNVSPDTVKAQWKMAKAWLYREISKESNSS